MLFYILSFLKSLSFIDYVLFFTVIFLLILIVSLIYFIKINEDNVSEIELSDPDNLKQIASLMAKTSPKPVKFTSYEKEQEDKAIISYDELLENTGQFSLNYLEEQNIEDKKDISVKKVDLEHLISPSLTNDLPKPKQIILLKKEEEFLEALKELQRLLI
ncbi:MAG: hypothetical protein GX951_03945 [Mollicutes bacterium]|nr:hypothetical protein [Mollicutes bacterium]